MPTDTETHGTENTSKLRTRLDEIKKLRGEIREKIDLAEGEVREGFLKIEPAVDRAEHELTHMAGDAAEAVAKTMDSLAESLHKIRARIKK